MSYNTDLGEFYDDTPPGFGETNANGPGSLNWYLNIARAQRGQQGGPQAAQQGSIAGIMKGPLGMALAKGAGHALFGGGGVAGTEAANAAYNAPASAATNAAWNAPGADAALQSSLANGTAGTEVASSQAPEALMSSANITPVGAESMGAAPAYAYALPALATALGGRYALRSLQGKTKNWKDASLADNAGRATLGIATGGLSEVYNKFFGGHESTADVWNRHTNDLTGMAPDNQNWQNVVAGYRNQEKPTGNAFHGGDYATWDDYKKAGLDAADLTGVHGILQALGPQYADTSFDQKKQIAQAAIDNNLFNSKKGEVEITDPEQFKNLVSGIMGVPPSA